MLVVIRPPGQFSHEKYGFWDSKLAMAEGEMDPIHTILDLPIVIWDEQSLFRVRI